MTYPNIEELWARLALERKFNLIRKLHRAEKGEPGYGTVAITREGFSEDNTTHNMVLAFLKKNNIHIINPGLEEACLELALRGDNGES